MSTRDSRASQVKVDLHSRRMFLKSASGLTLALPFLPSLLTGFAEKAMAAGETPLRYVQLFTPLGGLQHKNWMGSQLPTTPFQISPSQMGRIGNLASMVGSNGLSTVINSNFQNLFPHMNMMAGLDVATYWGHHKAASTGGCARNVDNYAPISDQTNFTGMIDIDCPTIDQVLAYAGGNGIYGSSISGRRRCLNISSGGASSSWGRDDYFNASSPVIPKDFMNSTSGAFTYLFGSVPQGQAQGSANPLLNLVNEFWPSGRSLLRFLSGDDKKSLDNLFQLAQQSANDFSGPVPNVGNPTKPDGTSDQWADDGSSLRAMADIILMAFRADVTRIVTFYAGDSLGLPWHSLSHSASLDTPNEGQDGLLKIHDNIAKNFFSYLGEKMRTTVDPSRSAMSLLDDSLMMWTQEHKVAHQNVSVPTLLMGSAGGRISTGNFIDFRNMAKPGYEVDISGDMQFDGEIINRLWASMFYAFNIPRTSYEITRTGPFAETLNKGYGHVIKNTANWYKMVNYDLSQIGEPWDVLKKAGTTWG